VGDCRQRVPTSFSQRNLLADAKGGDAAVDDGRHAGGGDRRRHDGSSASEQAIDAAVWLAVEPNAGLTFVYVRRGPLGLLGTPVFQRRLTAKMAQARRVLDRTLRIAARAEPPA
jgi:nucleotide-binding universal stress UspA family protein